MDSTLRIGLIIIIITNAIDLAFRIYDIIKNRNKDVSDEDED